MRPRSGEHWLLVRRIGTRTSYWVSRKRESHQAHHHVEANWTTERVDRHAHNHESRSHRPGESCLFRLRRQLGEPDGRPESSTDPSTARDDSRCHRGNFLLGLLHRCLGQNRVAHCRAGEGRRHSRLDVGRDVDVCLLQRHLLRVPGAGEPEVSLPGRVRDEGAQASRPADGHAGRRHLLPLSLQRASGPWYGHRQRHHRGGLYPGRSHHRGVELDA